MDHATFNILKQHIITLLGIDKKRVGVYIAANPARVAELVDARDLKSLDRMVVRVRFSPRAPGNIRV